MAKRLRKRDPVRPNPDEQSGSAGRPTGGDPAEQGKDTGQDRYGQSGFGGQQERETIGQASYRRSGPDGGQIANPKSNPGPDRADRDTKGDAGTTKSPTKKP